MHKKQSLFFRAIPFVMVFCNLHAQELPSPNVGALLKVNPVDVNEGTGQANISLPIYSSKIDDMTLPITLDYDSRGVSLNEEPGFAGSNWSLTMGGVISRDQRGEPDENDKRIQFFQGYDPSTGQPFNCQVAEIRSNNSWFSIAPNNTAHADYLVSHGNMNGYTGSATYGFGNPDTFNYILPNGRRGSFALNSYGTVISSTDDRVIVYPYQDPVTLAMDTNTISKIVIYDNLGNIFQFDILEQRKYDYWNSVVFGSFTGYTPKIPASTIPLSEPNASLSPPYICAEGSNSAYNSDPGYQDYLYKPVTSAWFLSKVTTAKGNVILFEYQDETHTKLTPTTTTFDEDNTYSGKGNFVHTNRLIRYTTKRLNRITTPTETININYKPTVREDVFTIPFSGVPFASTVNLPSELRAIASINVTNTFGQTLRSIAFNTSYRISNGWATAAAENKYLYKRLWLDGFTVNNTETYSFTYNADNLPYRLSYEQDYWGYYNANQAEANGKTMIPDLYYYSSDPRSFTRTTQFSIYPRVGYTGTQQKVSTMPQFATLAPYLGNRELNETTIQTGMLQRITYPGKGYDQFTYESNEFVFENIPHKGFGLRINKIETFNPDSPVPVSGTTYLYKKADGTTSGVVTNFGSFGRIASKLVSTGKLYYMISGGNLPASETLYYSRVEKQLLNNGKVISEYMIPYDVNTNTSMPFNGNFMYRKNFEFYYSQIMCTNINDCTSGNGTNTVITFPANTYEYPGSLTGNAENLFCKKTKEVAYDDAGNILQMDEFQYDFNNYSKKLQYHTSRYTDYFPVSTLIFADWDLKSHKVTRYVGQQPAMITLDTYTYVNNLLDTETRTNSLGQVQTTQYRYAPAFKYAKPWTWTDGTTTVSGQLNNIYQIMVNNNYLNYPVEIIKKSDGKVIDATFFDYGAFYYKLFVKTAMYKLDLVKPITDLMTSQPNSGYTETAANLVNKDARYRKVEEYHNYETTGGLMETSKSGAPHTVYIWGYKKMYPLAKIENLNYSQIPAATITYIQSLADADDSNCRTAGCPQESLRGALANLRLNFPGAMITSYTYDPGVGMTSMTDPRGKVTYYTYDDMQRLTSIIDKDGNITSENTYHYKP